MYLEDRCEEVYDNPNVGATVKRGARIPELVVGISEGNSRLDRTIIELSDMRNRLFGTVPQDGMAKAAQDSQDSIVSELEKQVSKYHAKIDIIESLVSEISQAI